MAESSLESLIDIHVFTTGRRLFALKQVRTVAQAQDFAELAQICEGAIIHDQATLEIEQRWAGETAGQGDPEAQRIDAMVDRTLGALRDNAEAQAHGAEPDDPIHHVVNDFMRRVFPQGVQAITHLPYMDELAAVDQIVTLLHGELAPVVNDLSLTRVSKRLSELAFQYRHMLEAPPASLVTWGKLRSARAEGQGKLLETIAVILGRFHDNSPSSVRARAALLGPILKQNEAIGEYIRARRHVDDVDPHTGQETPGVMRPTMPVFGYDR